MLGHFRITVSFEVERQLPPNDHWYLVTPVLTFLDNGTEERASSMLCQEEEIEEVQQAFYRVAEMAAQETLEARP